MTNRNIIINQALLLIGEEMIASEDDGSKNSDIASELIDLCIETALSEHDWLFARVRVTISAVNTAPPFGYKNRFLLPTNYNHIVVEEDDEYEYREEGGYILTDKEELELLYVSNITNLNLFPPKFTDAVVTLLASKIAYAITGTPGLGGSLEQLYEKRIYKAKMCNSNSIGIAPDDDSWIEER